MDTKVKTSTYICIMCGRRKKKGIKIHSGFICSHCEEEIVHTDVSDEKYPFFIQQMKKVWINNG